MSTVRRFFRDERGLELSKYAVMAGIVILMAVGVIILVADNINKIFTLLNIELGKVTGE